MVLLLHTSLASSESGVAAIVHASRGDVVSK